MDDIGKLNLKVYIRFEDGVIKCMCLRRCKKCDCKCEKDIVTYDKYRDGEKTFPQNRYGK